MIPAIWFQVRVHGRGNRQVWIGPHPTLNTCTTVQTEATRFGQITDARVAAFAYDQDTTIERCTLTTEDVE